MPELNYFRPIVFLIGSDFDDQLALRELEHMDHSPSDTARSTKLLAEECAMDLPIVLRCRWVRIRTSQPLVDGMDLQTDWSEFFDEVVDLLLIEFRCFDPLDDALGDLDQRVTMRTKLLVCELLNGLHEDHDFPALGLTSSS